jgi:hypothetical protein
MRPQWLIVALLATGLGCRTSCMNPFGCGGSRVPPPGTGSYTVPNSYYQPALPAAPGIAPQGIVPQGVRPLTPTSQWTTARDDSRLAAAPTPVEKQSPPSTGGMSTTAQGSGTLSLPPAPSTLRKGMQPNTVRAPAEPRQISPDSAAVELKPSPSAAVGTGVRAVQPASAVGNSRSGKQATSAVWQSRVESTP